LFSLFVVKIDIAAVTVRIGIKSTALVSSSNRVTEVNGALAMQKYITTKKNMMIND
jgi:hypothetical protein